MSNGHTKAGVMASLKRPSDASHAKFSKYSGVVEWRNAVLLWVNVGGRDYANAFADGGQRMTWYIVCVLFYTNLHGISLRILCLVALC